MQCRSAIADKMKHCQEIKQNWTRTLCKSVRIWSYFGPYFPAFGLNAERYGVSLRIQSECGKMRTRITPNRDTFRVAKLSYTK